MNKTNLKKKLKAYAPAIITGTSIIIGSAVLIHLAKRMDETGELLVVEVIADAATGKPKYILTVDGAYDLTPRIES